jgi:hypothetical protein
MLARNGLPTLLLAALWLAGTLGVTARSGQENEQTASVVRIWAGDFDFVLDRTIIAAGPVRFELTNMSEDLRHEAWIYPIDERDGPRFHEMLHLKRTGVRADEPEFIAGIVGRSGEVAAGATTTFQATLPPGVYELGCFIREGTGDVRMVHYDSFGMYAALVVRPTL